MIQHPFCRYVVAVAISVLGQAVSAQNVQQPAQAGATGGNTQAASGNKIPPPGTKLPDTKLPDLPKLPDVASDAYKQVTQEASPLTPEQIKSLRKLVDDAERAAAAPPRFMPKPVYSRVAVTLMPGETPPVVRLFANFLTNVLFLDQAGNPLKVLDINPGGASAFTVTPAKDGSNNIGLSPLSTYANGNISVTVEKVMTPISLTLVSGQREVDYRVDVQVKGAASPNSRGAGTTGELPSQPSSVMVGLLEGVAPDGAKNLISSNGEVQAWDYKSHFYVRTSLPLLSPAYMSMQRSADGTAVYEVTRTPVIVALSNGSAIQINLSGY